MRRSFGSKSLNQRALNSDTVPQCFHDVISEHIPSARLAEEDVMYLDKEVPMEDIHSIVRSIRVFIAPGPDKFQAMFYQNRWQAGGKSLFLSLIQRRSLVRRSSGLLVKAYDRLKWDSEKG